jgi:hypothetical protein
VGGIVCYLIRASSGLKTALYRQTTRGYSVFIYIITVKHVGFMARETFEDRGASRQKKIDRGLTSCGSVTDIITPDYNVRGQDCGAKFF